jgi:hypothetical protein
MADRWLLLEAFRGPGCEPTVIAVGRTPKRMQPLSTVLRRNPYIDELRALIARVVLTGEPVNRELTSDHRRQIIVHPLKSFRGNVHGVDLWTGDLDEEPPGKDLAGAWYFDRKTNRTGGSDELLDLYREPVEARRTERATAEAFGRLIPPPDETDALATLARAEAGAFHQATWTVVCNDGTRRAVNLAARFVEEVHPDGTHVVCRGITHDLGDAGTTPSAPRGNMLAQRVVDAEAEPGTYRAVVELTNLTLLRWVGPPMPKVAWKLEDGYHAAVHDDDLATAKELAARLRVDGRAMGALRVRAADGGWMQVRVDARLMQLDEHTSAALVFVSEPGTTNPA